MGQAPQSFAKAASERIRSGLSPNRINISAAVWAPTPKLARSVGDVSVVSRSRCRSCVAISSARVVHRRASARRVCLVDAVGVSSGPGRSPAQRVSRRRSVRSWRASRSGAGARTTICFRVIIATVRAFTAVSRATLSWRIISTAPSAVFGIAVDWPANTDRAATSASMVSDLPAARRVRRSPRFTSMTRCPARRTVPARPAP